MPEFPRSENSSENLQFTILHEKIDNNMYKRITSIVVLKDGDVVVEEYFNDANRSHLHDVRSVGKSFASAVVGMALQDNYLKNLEQTIGEFYDLHSYENYTPEKDKITLRSLLTMSSPFLGSDNDPSSPGNEENMYPTSDWVKFALDLPLDPAKTVGGVWDYFTAGIVLLGDILDRSLPNGLLKYTEDKLFAPLGIEDYLWPETPTRVPNTAGGLRLRSLDLAKFGLLYLNKGLYDGKHILERQWVQESTSNQIELPNNRGFYGYLLWNQMFTGHNKSYSGWFAAGNGGNKILWIDELDAVIVVTATAYGQSYMHKQTDEIIEQYLIPSLEA